MVQRNYSPLLMTPIRVVGGWGWFKRISKLIKFLVNTSRLYNVISFDQLSDFVYEAFWPRLVLVFFF